MKFKQRIYLEVKNMNFTVCQIITVGKLAEQEVIIGSIYNDRMRDMMHDKIIITTKAIWH